MKKLIFLFFTVVALNATGQKISDLPAATTIGTTNLFEIVQSNTSKQIPYSVIRANIGALISDSLNPYLLIADTTNKWLYKLGTAANSTLYKTKDTTYFVKKWEFIRDTTNQWVQLEDSTGLSGYSTIRGLRDTVSYALTGKLTNKGDYDASVNQWPSGTIYNGDWFTVNVPGYIAPDSLRVGDIITAKIDNPGQTNANWNIISNGTNISIPQARKINDLGKGYILYNGKTPLSGAIWSGSASGYGNDTINIAGTMRCNSINSYGVIGYSTNKYGLYGISVNDYGVVGGSTGGVGVTGQSTNNHGVYGFSVNAYGIYGKSTNSYGGFFSTATNKRITSFQKTGTNAGEKGFVDTSGNYFGKKFYNSLTVVADSELVTKGHTPQIYTGADTTNSTPVKKGDIFIDNSGNVYISKGALRGDWVKLNYILALVVIRRKKFKL